MKLPVLVFHMVIVNGVSFTCFAGRPDKSYYDMNVPTNTNDRQLYTDEMNNKVITRRDTHEKEETVEDTSTETQEQVKNETDAENERIIEHTNESKHQSNRDKDTVKKILTAATGDTEDSTEVNNYYIVKDEPPPLVSTAEGVLRGVRIRFNGVEYLSFMGIRYASPPERFQAPKPLKPWNGTINATRSGDFCLQPTPFEDLVLGSEDCLFLDVSTPTLDTAGLPVMAVVHGGAWKYLHGNSYYYDPSILMEHTKMVVVSFNYRLGALGFLSTRTPGAPGNAGMKDIIAALEWIQRNIHMFGGDPNRVTMYGVSSGAAAIEFLMLSKMAVGLFSRVIMQSASALNHINYQKEPLKYAFRLGKYLGNETIDADELLIHLKNASGEDIVLAYDKLDKDDSVMANSFTFVPCAEDPLPGERVFLSDHPFNIMQSGDFIDVPTMVGFNSVEGSEMIKRVYDDPEYFNKLESSFEYLMPNDLMESVDSHQEKKALMKKARDFYFNGERVSNATLKGCVDLLGDTIFLNGFFRSINIRLRKSDTPIYYWHFAFSRKNPLINDLGLKGSPHADDISYVFRMPFSEVMLTNDATAEASLRIVTMISNFMTYGNPTPNKTGILPIIWKPIQNKETLNYMEMTTELKIKQNPYKERRIFWEDLYSKKFKVV